MPPPESGKTLRPTVTERLKMNEMNNKNKKGKVKTWYEDDPLSHSTGICRGPARIVRKTAGKNHEGGSDLG